MASIGHPQATSEGITVSEKEASSPAASRGAESIQSSNLWTIFWPNRTQLLTITAWGAVIAVVIWAYWQPLWGLAVRWWKEADYGHGFFVPIFSALLLAVRWKDFRGKAFTVTGGAFTLGLVFLFVAWICRYVSHAYYFRLLEPASLIPALFGIACLAGGWRGLGWSWPAIVFLVFMIPLPGAVADTLRHPLQRIGTVASSYLLQVMGVPAIARGNIIVLSDAELGVVEACSGLRMMVLFFAVCVGAAFLVRRPLLDRVIMVLSAPVIAVAANIFRITLTGVLHELTTAELAEFVFHDLAGWLMAPVALGLLSAELWWLDKVLVPVKESPPPVMDFRKGSDATSQGHEPPDAAVRKASAVAAGRSRSRRLRR